MCRSRRPARSFCLKYSASVTNAALPFEEWTTVFGSQRLAGALLDRLTHHDHILELNGESYRLKQSKARRRRRRLPAPPGRGHWRLSHLRPRPLRNLGALATRQDCGSRPARPGTGVRIRRLAARAHRLRPARDVFVLYADRKLTAPEMIARIKTQFHLPGMRRNSATHQRSSLRSDLPSASSIIETPSAALSSRPMASAIHMTPHEVARETWEA